MRTYLVLIIAVISIRTNGQGDSLRMLRISGLQLKTGLLGSTHKGGTREDYLSIVKNNQVLNRDVAGYTGGQAYSSFSYNTYLDINLFADLKTKAKFPDMELSLGLAFGNNDVSSAYYSKLVYDTTGVYYNSVSKDTITTATVYENSLSYRIRSQQLFVPVGIHLTTQKSKRLWFTAGLELSPGLMFSNVFTGQEGLMKSEIYLKKDSDLKDPSTYARGDSYLGQLYSTDTKINALGFVGYATLPLSANLRLSKRAAFFKHMNLSLALSPGLYYSKSKFSATSTGLVLNSALALRYNW